MEIIKSIQAITVTFGTMINQTANTLVLRNPTREWGREDDELEEDEDLDSETLNRAYSFCLEVFGCGIIDESQKVKSVLTLTHKSVLDLNLPLKLLLTATPMINRPVAKLCMSQHELPL